MDLGLKGRIALITGGSKGIGGASALLLAQEGARVAISARTASELDQHAAAIRSATGTDVLAVPADCTDPKSRR